MTDDDRILTGIFTAPFLQLCQNILKNSLKLLHLSNEICRMKFYNNFVGSRSYISQL